MVLDKTDKKTYDLVDSVDFILMKSYRSSATFNFIGDKIFASYSLSVKILCAFAYTNKIFYLILSIHSIPLISVSFSA
ncbi:hypothetical protein HNP24_002140 [Chryseobacterium sediminis]|uniref:Uncharacterized protein n=1 Tax=Chryseobacterium sediminis TaxID=1679494 RepID=A0ABR6PZN2_9FLAO|nr:hypothetical protein [Chryseobacterium sediminis]